MFVSVNVCLRYACVCEYVCECLLCVGGRGMLVCVSMCVLAGSAERAW